MPCDVSKEWCKICEEHCINNIIIVQVLMKCKLFFLREKKLWIALYIPFPLVEKTGNNWLSVAMGTAHWPASRPLKRLGKRPKFAFKWLGSDWLTVGTSDPGQPSILWDTFGHIVRTSTHRPVPSDITSQNNCLHSVNIVQHCWKRFGGRNEQNNKEHLLRPSSFSWVLLHWWHHQHQATVMLSPETQQWDDRYHQACQEG